jgi:HTH-type transcriptional regulator/antitoxin HigA
MKSVDANPVAVKSAWLALQKSVGGLSAIRTGKDYDRMGALMLWLVDVVGDNEGHPLAALLDVVSDLVAAYEARAIRIAPAAPRDVLRFLMDSNRLAQTDLKEELGGQSVVSAVLNGKRSINARQAKALGARFGISPAAFLS